jgi:hypothetical protein
MKTTMINVIFKKQKVLERNFKHKAIKPAFPPAMCTRRLHFLKEIKIFDGECNCASHIQRVTQIIPETKIW